MSSSCCEKDCGVECQCEEIGHRTVGQKTIGELIDELITTSLKIWHLLDRAMGDNDAPAALEANKINLRRNALMQEINNRLSPDHNITGKYYEK